MTALVAVLQGLLLFTEPLMHLTRTAGGRRMTELLAPVAVQWHPGMNLHLNLQIAEAIVRNRILMAYLRGGNALPFEHILELCEMLTGGGVKVILVIDTQSLKGQSHLLEGIRVYLEPDDPEAPARYGQTGITGIAISVSEPVVQRLPVILRKLYHLGYRSVYFPLPRVDERLSERVMLPGAEALKRVSVEMKSVPEDMEIIVHDPMLDWLVFGRRGHGGCSGGDTTVFIRGDGDVFPCPLIPVKLGNMKETPLEYILTSQERISMVRQLWKIPEKCRDCKDVETCRGGCRGRAFLMEESLERQDPACPVVL
ncbi:MAG: SPASM domain-containing protein [Nitrospirae bacterium]|nr:MAG: SPASM domain-containing protein [Nitrospirota bacterium]